MEIIRHHFVKINSTNTWAKEQVEDFTLGAMTVVTADEQTEGRGRFRRKWISPPGQNIYCTFCFFLPNIPSNIGNIPQVLALSAAQVIEKYGFTCLLKWPNDLLVSGKKIGGILCETTQGLELGQYLVVVGIGINVNMPKELTDPIDRPATSLLIESGSSFSVKAILEELISCFNKNIEVFLKEGFSSFYPEFVGRSVYKKGDPIKFHDHDRIWEGTFDSIQPDGSLHFRLPSGEIKHFTVGEIPY